MDPRTEDANVVNTVREVLSSHGIKFSTIEVAKEDKRGKPFRISSLYFSSHGGDWVYSKDWRGRGTAKQSAYETEDSLEIMM